MSKRKTSPSTHKPPTATQLAKERDEYTCQWHLVVFGLIREGLHGHHLFRPRKLYDRPEYIITLCEDCHMGGRHIKGALTDQMMIEHVMIPYIWGGADLSPRDNLISQKGF